MTKPLTDPALGVKSGILATDRTQGGIIDAGVRSQRVGYLGERGGKHVGLLEQVGVDIVKGDPAAIALIGQIQFPVPVEVARNRRAIQNGTATAQAGGKILRRGKFVVFKQAVLPPNVGARLLGVDQIGGAVAVHVHEGELGHLQIAGAHGVVHVVAASLARAQVDIPGLRPRVGAGGFDVIQ